MRRGAAPAAEGTVRSVVCRGRVGRLVVVGAVAAAVAAGCGSSSSKASSPGGAGGQPVGHAGDSAVLSTAYSRAVAARSAKMNLNVSITLPTKQTSVTGSGAFDWGQRLGQLTFQAPIGGQNLSLTEILDGTSVYVQLPPSAAAQLGKPWVRADMSGLAQSGATSDPSQTLAVLEGSSDSVTNLGHQVIGGVQTTHYRAQVDPSKAAASAPPAAQQLLSQLPALTGGSTIPMDAWVDAQGLPRRVSYTITLRQPPAGSPPAAAQAFPETTVATMDLSDYGVPVSVTPPPPDQVATQSIPGFSSGSSGSGTGAGAGAA